ncbi:MAG: GTPase domain-containing protein [Candidatus Aminicenantes bacterium]|nr:GTPase domain-containing protein [Candidatus Aminicenantes bacterium]
MAFYNYITNNVAIKVVYYGPGLSGKTTNLRYIFQKLDPSSRGDLLCLESDTDRTFFFDLLPISAGLIDGFKIHFQLMTVPGQVYYDASRKSVLKNADGIIFVTDSQTPLLDANLECFDGLRRNLQDLAIDMNTFPIVFQYNKRDLEDLIPVETFNNLLNPKKLPYFEASAINGMGVFETLRAIAELTIPTVRERIQAEKHEAEDSIQEENRETEKEASAKTLKEVTKQIEEALGEKPTSVAYKMSNSQVLRVKMKSEKDIEKELERLSLEYISR